MSYVRTKKHRQAVRELGLKNKGKIRSLEFKANISGENSPRWNPDRTSYNVLHNWVKEQLGTPDTCENCGRTNLKGYFINWANISGKYLKDVSDWARLCRRCHMFIDNSVSNQYMKKELSK